MTIETRQDVEELKTIGKIVSDTLEKHDIDGHFTVTKEMSPLNTNIL